MKLDPVIRVRLTASSIEALRTFIDETQPDLGCRPAVQRTPAGCVTDVYFPESQLAAARASRAADDVSLQVVENTTEIGLARQAEVGTGDRFAARGVLPRGMGLKKAQP